MRILSLHPEIVEYLKKHNLENKFIKQKHLFESNIHHSSLNIELLEPKHLRFFSFRIDKKYRAIFIFRDSESIEIIDVNNHYQ